MSSAHVTLLHVTPRSATIHVLNFTVLQCVPCPVFHPGETLVFKILLLPHISYFLWRQWGFKEPRAERTAAGYLNLFGRLRLATHYLFAALGSEACIFFGTAFFPSSDLRILVPPTPEAQGAPVI
jgi:hypothetical protein